MLRFFAQWVVRARQGKEKRITRLGSLNACSLSRAADGWGKVVWLEEMRRGLYVCKVWLSMRVYLAAPLFFFFLRCNCYCYCYDQLEEKVRRE